MLEILLNKKNSVLINKILPKVISCLLINLIILSNIALAGDLSYNVVISENQNLSPRISIDNNALNNMFISSLPEIILQAENKDSDLSILDKIVQYAYKKKQESEGKGILKNPLVILFSRGVKKIEQREPYNLKSKQKKVFTKDVNKLKKLLSERRKWIEPDLAKEYASQINDLERLLESVKTKGDWDDLLGLKAKLNKSLEKHGALANALLSAFGNQEKKKKSPQIVKQNKQKKRKKTFDTKEERFEKNSNPQEHLPLNIEQAEASINNSEQGSDIDQEYPSATISIDKPQSAAAPVSVKPRRMDVLEIAFEKLEEIYVSAAQSLPKDVSADFKEKIDVLFQSIVKAKTGEFRARKDDITNLKQELLNAIKENNKVIAATEEAKLKDAAAKTTKKNNGNVQPVVKAKKAAQSLDPFDLAVTLCDPVKIPLRPAEDVVDELKGQIELLKQIIDAEMHNSIEMSVYNRIREADGLIVQVGLSEAREKIEVGSDILMYVEVDNEVKYYDFKCSKILNSGSHILLNPANRTKTFTPDFPNDISKAKFRYMPSTHSEDLQKKTLRAIIRKINGKDKSTGVAVLDYFLRIKSAVRDIIDIEQLKEPAAYTENLDKFQLAAVNMIIKTKFGLIFGPFGTGKTSVLLAAAKNIILNKKKPVFIIAPQHKIADDITLKAGDSQMPVIRFGKKSRKINPEVLDKYSRHSAAAQKEFMRRYKELNVTDSDNGCLFVGTDMGASLDLLIRQLRDPESEKFLKDVTVIVDEAALINYPELITTLYVLRPDALILVGDHVQFSPYKLVSRFSSKIMDLFKNIPQKAICRYHKSSFKELILLPFNKVSLLINYRNPWISVDLLQDWYKGIVNLQSISKQRGDLLDEDTFVIEDTSTWDRQSFSEPYQYGNSPCNKTEALWIVKRIKYFLDKGNKPEDITVITYYNGQIKLISDLIDGLIDADGGISNSDAQILKQNIITPILKENIFTPISFQGGENKIVLVSLVMSEKVNNNGNNSYNANKINPIFLSEPEFAKAEALLVMLSRHKGKISVIGNKDTLDSLTKDKYKRVNYLYSLLFSYKDRIKVCLELQNVELTKNKARGIKLNNLIHQSI